MTFLGHTHFLPLPLPLSLSLTLTYAYTHMLARINRLAALVSSCPGVWVCNTEVSWRCSSAALKIAAASASWSVGRSVIRLASQLVGQKVGESSGSDSEYKSNAAAAWLTVGLLPTGKWRSPFGIRCFSSVRFSLIQLQFRSGTHTH